MTTFTGGDKNIQRVVRRSWNYCQATNPDMFKALPGAVLLTIIKSIVIAFSEELADLNLPTTNPQGIVDFDLTTDSALEPVPYDPDV